MRKFEFTVAKDAILQLAAQLGGRARMELEELAEHHEFIMEQLHLWEAEAKEQRDINRLVKQVQEVAEGILRNDKRFIR